MGYKKEYLPLTNEKYRVYFDKVDRLRLQSKILNSDSFSLTDRMIFISRENVENELNHLRGDKNGQTFALDEKHYYRTGRREYKSTPSKIAIVKAEITAIEEKFVKTKKAKVMMGQSEPLEMDKHSFNEKLLMEAKLTVMQEEVEVLQKIIDKCVAKDKEKVLSNVLKDGPTGIGRLRNGVLCELDGMACSLSGDNIPYISETHPKAAPFLGFSCADYFQYIVRPWALAKQEQAKKNQEEIKKQMLLNPDYKTEQLSKGYLSGGSNIKWPTMPETCKNYLKKEETKEITRTKK